MHDVFGGLTLVERADRDLAEPPNRWTMFSTTISPKGQIGDFFIVPPSATSLIQEGPTLEDALFIRDEMANMAWAIERTTENEVGDPQSGYEEAIRTQQANEQPPSARGEHGSPLRYQIQTHVPVNWFPLLPVQIQLGRDEVGLELETEIALELGTMLTPGLGEVPPRGRILTPTRLSDAPYRIREEEVPRSGVRVIRHMCRCRGVDGRTYVWQLRRKRAGVGEGSSGLRFDLAIVD